MDTKLKHVLIIAGIAAGVVTTGVIVWRAFTPKATVPPAVPPPTGQPRPPRPPLTHGTDRLGVSYPVWDRTAENRAAAIMADIYDQMGSPVYNPQTVVELAWSTANEMWPDWNWPTNTTQSNLFLQSADLGLPVWQHLVDMAQTQMGYYPVT